MAEHTPGPWRVKYHESSPDQIAAVVSDHDLICAMPIDRNANARLIAAAPELLAALEAVLLFYRGDWWDEGERQEWSRLAGTQEATTKVLCDVVRAALAKARGVADPTSADERSTA